MEILLFLWCWVISTPSSSCFTAFIMYVQGALIWYDVRTFWKFKFNDAHQFKNINFKYNVTTINILSIKSERPITGKLVIQLGRYIVEELYNYFIQLYYQNNITMKVLIPRFLNNYITVIITRALRVWLLKM